MSDTQVVKRTWEPKEKTVLVQRIEHGNIFELLCILKHPSAHTLKMGDACIDGLLLVNLEGRIRVSFYVLWALSSVT